MVKFQAINWLSAGIPTPTENLRQNLTSRMIMARRNPPKKRRRKMNPICGHALFNSIIGNNGKENHMGIPKSKDYGKMMALYFAIKNTPSSEQYPRWVKSYPCGHSLSRPISGVGRVPIKSAAEAADASMPEDCPYCSGDLFDGTISASESGELTFYPFSPIEYRST